MWPSVIAGDVTCQPRKRSSHMVAISLAAATIGLLPACAGPSPAPAGTTAAPPTSSAPAPVSPSSPLPASPSVTTLQPVPPPATSPRPQSTAPSTPARPPAGTAFSGEGISGAPAQQLQEAVDQGNMTWRRSASAVAEWFVRQRFGWIHVNVQFGSRFVAFVTDHSSGQRLSLHLAQPAKRNDGGVWVVESGMWA